MTIETTREHPDKLTRAHEEELELAFFASAIRYAQLRAQGAQSSCERRREMDASRTRAHDALTDACNILSQAQVRLGGYNNWRTNLGNNRQSIGDFACFIYLFLALSAR